MRGIGINVVAVVRGDTGTTTTTTAAAAPTVAASAASAAAAPIAVAAAVAVVVAVRHMMDPERQRMPQIGEARVVHKAGGRERPMRAISVESV